MPVNLHWHKHLSVNDNDKDFSPVRVHLIIFTLLLGVSLFTMPKKSEASSTHLILDTTKGQIEIELLPNLAPKHVERIIELASTGFYNDVIFHRVIPGFMAQTGDPTGTGMGGSGTNLQAEFSDYAYREGTVGMARAMNPNSADSQFFICFDGCGHLTGEYTAWGQVSRGMDIVKKINEGQPPEEPDAIIATSLK